MKWEMEILSSDDSSYISNTSRLFEPEKKTRWTAAENKAFENALAVFDKNTPHRWHKVAEMVPGKTVLDVIRQYKELEDDVSSIEAGVFPFPLGFEIGTSSPFTFEYGDCQAQDFGGFKQYSHEVKGKKKSSSLRLPSEQDRKKGIPWTEEEHKLFLMGLKKYGKGDWRNISRNYVITRTSTQVASHAQKYFMRQISGGGGKDKRRTSIHDITTLSLIDTAQMMLLPSSSSSPNNNQKTTPSSPDRSMLQSGQKISPYQWSNFSSGYHGTMLLNDYDMKGGQNMQRERGFMCDANLGCQNMSFYMQSAYQYPHA